MQLPLTVDNPSELHSCNYLSHSKIARRVALAIFKNSSSINACRCGNPVEAGGGVLHRARGCAQRRYEALRAYFVEDASAAAVADRFGYSTASVHQMATLLRTGKLDPFTETKPGPK